jgi:hypothetical protein
MIPNQDNKDVIYNESLLMIDSFMQITVNQFIENAPDDFTVGKKYIIINEEYKDYICYLSHESKSFQYFKPQTGMILFVIERNNFFIYNGENWQEIILNSNFANEDASIDSPPSSSYSELSSIPLVFTEISGNYKINSNRPYIYLYLTNNVTLNLDSINTTESTFIIKQCYNASYALTWPDEILWENNVAHKITEDPNNMDIIKLYKLPNTRHFLGKIIAQNFQF